MKLIEVKYVSVSISAPENNLDVRVYQRAVPVVGDRVYGANGKMYIATHVSWMLGAVMYEDKQLDPESYVPPDLSLHQVMVHMDFSHNINR